MSVQHSPRNNHAAPPVVPELELHNQNQNQNIANQNQNQNQNIANQNQNQNQNIVNQNQMQNQAQVQNVAQMMNVPNPIIIKCTSRSILWNVRIKICENLHRLAAGRRWWGVEAAEEKAVAAGNTRATRVFKRVNDAVYSFECANAE
ncbi:unnamed protein product [Trichogramma brassicae]|uniref:Uncharacterized protein n=1 Tax=Trichogramma brassicae TaxID=86971 RepID=A0A6H5IU58_9HYME|nr:unnamed protein product [Trichogramma brassicae]